MEIKTYNCYNGDIKIEINPKELIEKIFDRTELILKYLDEFKPNLTKDYLTALKKRLSDALNDFTANSDLFDLKTIGKNLEYLNKFQDLQELIIQFAWKYLALPTNYVPKLENVEVTSLNRAKADERLSYYQVKAFVDILGKDEGVQLYTRILSRVVREMTSKRKSNPDPSILKNREGAIKWWCKEGIADFTVAFDDDYKTLFRFDRCVTHEALKDLNDPDIAYICSCYIGDIEEYNVGKVIHLRRTQTLHHGDFCDELWWDTRVHDNPKLPALEFTRKLGKE
ncbi:MAG: L-2-amino-thiazoline-4-carboxylic acid hydrolase [Promethearchaeota archaeon]